MGAIRATCAVDCKIVLGGGAVRCPHERLLRRIDADRVAVGLPAVFQFDDVTAEIALLPFGPADR